MKKKILDLNFDNQKKRLQVYSVEGIERIVGLMFSRRRKSRILLFEFKKPVRIAIHSLFVFFPFLAIWTDEKNNIIEGKIVKPFRFYVCPKKTFLKLIEVPLKEDYKNKDLSSIWKDLNRINYSFL